MVIFLRYYNFRNVDFSGLSHGSGKSFDTVSEDIFSDDFHELDQPMHKILYLS